MGKAALAVLIVAASGLAQTGRDARGILQAIADAARSAGSVRAEGVRTDDDPGRIPPYHKEIRFEQVTQGPLLLRYRTVDGANALLRVCDGTSHWEYREPAKSYTRYAEGQAGCPGPLGGWDQLSANLVSATVTGRDRSEFAGRSRECEVIRAEYRPAAGPVVRTFCIDPARHVVLKESVEEAAAAGPAVGDPAETGGHAVTLTYSRVEYNRPHPAEFFQFEPPPGSSQGGLNLPLTGEGGSYSGPPPAPGGAFARPRLIAPAEPQYTPEALQARLQGTVRISLIVGEDGIPRNLKVVSGLGMGLDEKALEAAARYRFQAGLRNGEPAAVPAQVEVRFRIP